MATEEKFGTSYDILKFMLDDSEQDVEKAYKEKFYPFKQNWSRFLYKDPKKEMMYKNFVKQLKFLKAKFYLESDPDGCEAYSIYKINLDRKKSLLCAFVDEYIKQYKIESKELEQLDCVPEYLVEESKENLYFKHGRKNLLRDMLGWNGNSKQTICKILKTGQTSLDNYLNLCRTFGMRLMVKYNDKKYYLDIS